MVVAKQLAALVIEDVPGDVQIQIDRQEFVEKKLIFCAADDQIEVPDCVEIKILRRVRRPPRHRRDACSMAWRCRFLTARRSQHGSVIAEK